MKQTRTTRVGRSAVIVAAGCCGIMSVQASGNAVDELLVVGKVIDGARLDARHGASNRLGLSALETPASVDLITRDDMDIKGDLQTLDAVTRSAGISASASPGNGGSSVSSRGFNGHNTTLNTYDGTRLYITAGTVTFPADTWTLERVEVLRGAGSVVHGMGALGATINYVPKAPVFGEREFESLISTGSFGTSRIALGGGAQLGEQWGFRLDAARHQSDGFVDRADERRDVVAGALEFRPFDGLSLRFSVDYADIDDAPYWGTPLIDGEARGAHRKNNYNFRDAFVRYQDLWPRLRSEWHLTPNVTFRNDTYWIAAEREWQNLEIFAHDADADQINRSTFLGIIHDQTQLGTRSDVLIRHDLAGMRNRVTVGAEVNAIDLDYHNNFRTGGFGVADSVPVFGFDPGTLPRNAHPTILDFSTETRQYAVFADNVLEVSDALSLVVGGRYDDFDFERFNHPQEGREASSFDARLSDFTWRAGVVYRPLATLSLYAQTSTAADPVTAPVTISAANRNFDLSTGRQYEVGVKQQVLDGRAEYTLAYFDIKKNDMVTRRPGSDISEQIGQQSSRGLEVTMRATPLDGVSVDFNAAFVDAEFDEFFQGDASLAGNRPRNVPRKTANLWVNWMPVTAVRVGTGLRYVDSRFADDANTEVLPSYTVVDASINWTINTNLALTLRARNLTDEKDYVLSRYATDQWIFGPPRSYDVSFRYAL